MIVISFSLHPSERDLVSVFHDIAYAPGAWRRHRPCLSGLLFFLELHLIVIRLGSKRRRLPALLLKYDNCWSLMLLTPPQGRAGKLSVFRAKTLVACPDVAGTQDPELVRFRSGDPCCPSTSSLRTT